MIRPIIEISVLKRGWRIRLVSSNDVLTVKYAKDDDSLKDALLLMEKLKRKTVMDSLLQEIANPQVTHAG